MSDVRLKALGKKLDGLKTLAATARETAAERRFLLGDVAEAMTVAASAGQDTVTIFPDIPLDLRDTRAAIDTTAMLKSSGFEVTWEKRQTRPDDPPMWVMIVEWRRTSR